MTILHVLKYPPRYIIKRWGDPDSLDMLLPAPIIERLVKTNAYTITGLDDDLIEALQQILLEYEGDL